MIKRQGDLFRIEPPRAPVERARQAHEGPDVKFARSLFSKHGRDAWHVDLKQGVHFRDIELDKCIWPKPEVLASIGRLMGEAGITDCTITESSTARGMDVLRLSMPSATFKVKTKDMQQVADAQKAKAAAAGQDAGAMR